MTLIVVFYSKQKFLGFALRTPAYITLPLTHIKIIRVYNNEAASLPQKRLRGKSSDTSNRMYGELTGAAVHTRWKLQYPHEAEADNELR